MDRSVESNVGKKQTHARTSVGNAAGGEGAEQVGLCCVRCMIEGSPHVAMHTTSSFFLPPFFFAAQTYKRVNVLAYQDAVETPGQEERRDDGQRLDVHLVLREQLVDGCVCLRRCACV